MHLALTHRGTPFPLFPGKLIARVFAECYRKALFLAAYYNLYAYYL